MPVASMKSDNEASVQRTDSQRSQSNGPRVSFNKDVHVKKIGRRSADSSDGVYVPNIRRELPSDLSDRALKREAALVISQAEKANHSLPRNSSDSKRRREDRAGSLSNRKVIGRSASDASSKKSKRPSIFNFFSSKKNEYNFDEEERERSKQTPTKPVSRSKSDVGTRNRDCRKSPRRKSSDSDEVGDRMKKNPQLSPIIEDLSRDDYFDRQRPDCKLEESDELDLVPSKISKPATVDLVVNRTNDAMHSSQLPAEKPPLTKGVRVPSMVKRLSMEKLSPPPTSDAFTYISPPRKEECDKKIIYAEVVCGGSKEARDADEVDFAKSCNKDSYFKTGPFNGRRHDDDFELCAREQSPAERFASKYKSSQTYSSENNHNLNYDDDDEVILPKIRDLPPEKPSSSLWELGRRGQADGKEYFPEFNELSNRREELYSRIKSRINSGPREIAELPTKRSLVKQFEAPDDSTLVSRKHTEAHRQVHTRRKYEYPYLEYVPHEKSQTPAIKDSPVSRRSPSPFNAETRRHFSPPREVFKRESFSPEPSSLSPILEQSYGNRSKVRRDVEVERGVEEITHKTDSKKITRQEPEKLRKKTVRDVLSPEKLLQTTKKFLDRERRHTDETYKTLYIYRERSIDDGSRYDPRIDKYETSTNSLQRKRERVTQTESKDKSDKRLNSLGRMKKLIMGSGNVKSSRSNNENLIPNSQPQMTSDEEMRSRYKEYSGGHSSHFVHQSNEVQEIANRRRLSTPRSSPVVFRSVSKSATPVEAKPAKTSWFKSLDRLSRRKSSSKELDEKKRERSLSPLKKAKSPLKPKQNLRFFGDSDLESNDNVSKPRTTPKTRKSTTNLKSNKLYSQSAFNLNSEPPPAKARNGATPNGRSSSLYDLDKSDNSLRRNRRVTRSRELHNISEDVSTSENETGSLLKQSRKYGGSETKLKQRRGHSSSSERVIPVEYERDRSSDERNKFVSLDRRFTSRHAVRDDSRERKSMSPMRQSYERELTPRGGDYKKPPAGPPKPARDFQRRREIERIHDSSEGESSQRSVVYLHATTVGDIPQQSFIPPTRSSTKSVSRSRDDLSYITVGNKVEPMTKTVSRSVSMLAPWRPVKYIGDGSYEIDYSKDQTRHYVVPVDGTSSSTLPKQQKHRESRERSSKSSDRTPHTLDRYQSRHKNSYDSSYRSGYDLDHHRRDSPIGSHTYRPKVIV